MPWNGSVDYSRHMVEVISTVIFDRWLRKLKDREARLRIVDRIERLAQGNPGDVKPVGHGVSELRLTYGPGYRVYYLPARDRLVLLLCGGDKATQRKDVAQAHQLAEKWRSEEGQDGAEP